MRAHLVCFDQYGQNEETAVEEEIDEEAVQPPSMSYADWLFERSCKRKMAYATLGIASRARLIKQERYQHRLYPYQCRFCALWHLTKNSQRDQPK